MLTGACHYWTRLELSSLEGSFWPEKSSSFFFLFLFFWYNLFLKGNWCKTFFTLEIISYIWKLFMLVTETVILLRTWKLESNWDGDSQFPCLSVPHDRLNLLPELQTRTTWLKKWCIERPASFHMHIINILQLLKHWRPCPHSRYCPSSNAINITSRAHILPHLIPFTSSNY